MHAIEDIDARFVVPQNFLADALGSFEPSCYAGIYQASSEFDLLRTTIDAIIARIIGKMAAKNLQTIFVRTRFFVV
jgi:hypothetical protein